MRSTGASAQSKWRIVVVAVAVAEVEGRQELTQDTAAVGTAGTDTPGTADTADTTVEAVRMAAHMMIIGAETGAAGVAAGVAAGSAVRAEGEMRVTRAAAAAGAAGDREAGSGASAGTESHSGCLLPPSLQNAPEFCRAVLRQASALPRRKTKKSY